MQNCPRKLAEVLAPLATPDFLNNYLGKNYFYSPGQRGRFAGLLPWAELNRILRQHRLDPPRLRLVREGQAVPPTQYLTYHTPKRGGPARTPRLRAQDLTRQLREGATLVLDSVDELYDPLSELIEDLETELSSRVQVNMYAGWRTSHGFDVHWDDHDVLILQVSGRKHWKVYPMTRPYPLAADPKGEAPKEPLWEGLLEDGDLLYIPRGWWHVAVPLEEPTLHLTVGLHTRTGLDLLSWFQDRLRESEAVRQDVPRFAATGERSAYLQRIRDAWLQAWTPELLDEYLQHLDEQTQPRHRFALPWTATADLLPRDGNGWQIQWRVPRRLSFPPPQSTGILELRCLGKKWKFAEAARPLLQLLSEKRECAVEDLNAAAAGSLSPETVRAFVRELADSGLVAIVPARAVV